MLIMQEVSLAYVAVIMHMNQINVDNQFIVNGRLFLVDMLAGCKDFPYQKAPANRELLF